MTETMRAGRARETLEPVRTGVVFEPRELAEEGEIDLANGPVSLFRYDDLGNALARRIRVIDFVAVNEKDQVGVLFDGARFAQVGHHRPLVLARVDAAIQL